MIDLALKEKIIYLFDEIYKSLHTVMRLCEGFFRIIIHSFRYKADNIFLWLQ